MHATSELYKRLIENPFHEKEIKINIAGVDYFHRDIVSAAVYGGIYDAFGIGNTSSRQISIELFPIGEIPRQAQIKVYVRLVFGAEASEWIPKGVFWISNRKRDKLTGTLKIQGFDAMLKSESVWLTSDYADVNWPMPQIEAVNDIATRMGIQVDSRTNLTSQFPVSYPIDENGDLTMREVLSYIAVSNAGNWIISDEGKLLLVGMNELPQETNYLVTGHGNSITFGGVRIVV